ncbi:MAG: hypothetical protein HY786_00160 [Deltaproteobacteria bacterium]|nr:hypothetical protein [Deltaproteobacteria bacterium]
MVSTEKGHKMLWFSCGRSGFIGEGDGVCTAILGEHGKAFRKRVPMEASNIIIRENEVLKRLQECQNKAEKS